jgi:copper chaperone NosL
MLPFRSRLGLGAAALLLLGMFVFPLWRVSLAAPQYPEGLGMQIGIRTITGFTPNDLGNINNLNHYIGMKRIVPEAIPELRYMPWILGALIALGLAGAVSGRRAIGVAFVVAFVVLAVAGLADFWWWEYDYGHNLDLENAIIRIPGMSYQPPLIGSRQLLNFTATSLPGPGAWFAFAAATLAMAAVWSGRRRRGGDAQHFTPSRAA